MKGTDAELVYLVKSQETEDFSSLMGRASRFQSDKVWFCCSGDQKFNSDYSAAVVLFIC